MPSVCLYFQVHQPFRLRRYSVFDIGRRHDYFDDVTNEAIARKVAAKCYLPTNALLLELIERHEGRFRVAFSITGTALEQFEQWCPEVLASFQALAATGCVEFLAETYYHSLAFLVRRRRSSSSRWTRTARPCSSAVRPAAPRLPQHRADLQQRRWRGTSRRWAIAGILAEGADHILGYRRPNFVYQPAGAPRLALLLKNYRLSRRHRLPLLQPRLAEMAADGREVRRLGATRSTATATS